MGSLFKLGAGLAQLTQGLEDMKGRANASAAGGDSVENTQAQTDDAAATADQMLAMDKNGHTNALLNAATKLQDTATKRSAASMDAMNQI